MLVQNATEKKTGLGLESRMGLDVGLEISLKTQTSMPIFYFFTSF